jgi:hypothetical protein
MKRWFFVSLMFLFSLYILFASFFGLNPNYGVYALLITMAIELLLDRKEKKNGNKT